MEYQQVLEQMSPKAMALAAIESDRADMERQIAVAYKMGPASQAKALEQVLRPRTEASLTERKARAETMAG